MNNNFIAQIQNLNLDFQGKKLFNNLNFDILENTISALLGTSELENQLYLDVWLILRKKISQVGK